MTTKFLYSSIVLLLILSSCNEKNDPVVTTTIDVSKQWSVDMFGVAVNPLSDGQWQTKTFTLEESNLFNSLDTANLRGTTTPQSVIDTPPGYNPTFPNPFVTVNTLALRFSNGFSGQVFFKAVVVDSTMTSYFKVATRLNVQNGFTALQLNPTIPTGRFRYYYTLSSQANPHFFKS
ncbi:hypothetical protein ACAW74_16745 [Fibrella sp. WM1]|uniref:hypothetical protein n=1 Tax=Fibrella musci TaxID=3242485 RepID=UPI003521130B